MGGGKKRKSVNKLASTGAEQNADTNNKRIVHSNGNDSDYGVFSDPDEASDDKQPQSPTSPHSYIVELSPTEAIIEDASQLQSQSQSQSHSETTNVVIQEAAVNTDKVSSEATESIIILDKSLDTLKMKLEKDAVYSKKTTLTSFFSYIILAMEIDIACSSTTATHNLAGYDSTNAERLIEYIIRNHSSTSEVEQFTLTMLQLGIVTHIMNGVIEFNKTARASTDSSNHSHTLQTLQSLEQLNLSQSGETGAGAAAATTQATPTPTPTPTPTQNPKQPNRFIRFWRNMSLCCCKCRKSRKDSILESTSNDSDESNKSDEATMTTIMTTTKTSEENSSLKQSNAGEEMKELTI
jgi:hypothetical protein